MMWKFKNQKFSRFMNTYSISATKCAKTKIGGTPVMVIVLQ